MEERLILITTKLPLFIKFNTFCNDCGWMVYNVTEPHEIHDLITQRNVAGIIWDLDVASNDVTLKTVAQIRKTFDKPIITLASIKDLEMEMKLFAVHVDDYLVEPYDYEEIIIRIQQALWSRNRNNQQENNLTPAQTDDHEATKSTHHHKHRYIQFDDLTLDVDHYRVLKDHEDLELTPKEFKLLYFLIKNKGQVLSREQLLQGVWDYNDLGTSRIVDIHISHLRDKIEPDPHHPKYIKTSRGFGYIFEYQNITTLTK